MIKKGVLVSKSVIDFLYMFFSNIIKKGFGLFREIILAYLFGSSIMYANFILLRTTTQLLSQFTDGNALQANLLPKFSKIYSDYSEVSLNQVFSFSKKTMYLLFFISFLSQIPVLYYINPEELTFFICISILLSVVVSLSFFSSVFLVIMQAKGLFKLHSFATTFDMLISTFVLYPVSLLFGVIGIVISRIIGMYSLVVKYLKPLLKENEGYTAIMSAKDLNLSILLLGNFVNIIILSSRFVSGLDAGNNITFFNYSIVLLNVLITAIVLNVNTIVLRKLSITKNRSLILLSVGIALFLGLGMVFFINTFGYEVIALIFQRGAFTMEDTMQTFNYAKDLSWSFVLISISSSLFQPYFSLNQNLIRNSSKVMAMIFVIAVLGVITVIVTFDFSAKQNSLIMIYSMSFLSVLLAITSIFQYKKYSK